MKKNNTIKALSIFTLLCLPFVSILAQGTLQDSKQNPQTNAVSLSTAQENEMAEEGTYLFEQTSKFRESFTKQNYKNIRVTINQNRDPLVEKTIIISSLTKVIIPSWKTIQSPNFTPYTTLFVN